MKGAIMTGTIEDFDGKYYTIRCDTDKPYLQILHLVPGQMAGHKAIGQRVLLQYQTTPSSGLWNVIGEALSG